MAPAESSDDLPQPEASSQAARIKAENAAALQNPRPAAAESHGPLVTLTEENDDLANNGDQHYTQGIRLSYSLGENRTPYWATRVAETLPDLGMKMEAVRFGLAAGQNMYTPKNIFTPSMVRTDRPYAGWLYLGTFLQRRGLTSRETPVLDNIELDLGIIGPESLAEETQTWWHALGGWIVPLGWHNQLKSEPGLVLKYDRQWKFSPSQPEAGWGLEFIPHAGVSLGNVQTFAVAGGVLRAGYNLPDDFGTQNIDSLATQAGGRTLNTHCVGGYFFVGLDGRAVARNAFLDGNLWRHSLSVEKEPLVADFRAGGVLAFRHFDLALSFVQRSREFKMQTRNDQIGRASCRERV